MSPATPNHTKFGGRIVEILTYKVKKGSQETMTLEVGCYNRLLKHVSFVVSDVQSEPWFGSQYKEESIPPSMLESWKNPPKIDVALHVPTKNEFIPKDFSIRSNGVMCYSGDASPPECIIDEPLMKFWYKLDKPSNGILHLTTSSKADFLSKHKRGDQTGV